MTIKIIPFQNMIKICAIKIEVCTKISKGAVMWTLPSVVSKQACEGKNHSYVCSIKGPTRCAFLCILYSSLFLALNISGAICTHLQEHNCIVQP
jgi:hypothetical protein